MSISLPVLKTGPIRPDYARGPASLDAVQLLRLSVTDRCNLRCVYCMPDEGVDFGPADETLSADDLYAVAEAAFSVGVRHFKLTGGEPTVRRDLPGIVERIADLEPDDISLTTNGLLLPRMAGELRRAGLDRMTISWDTMRPQRYDRFARGGTRALGGLDGLYRGIDAAVDAGFERLKFNVVVMGGLNDDEVADFARLTLDHPWTVRFIEYMPLGDSTLIEQDPNGIGRAYTVDNEQIRNRIREALGPLTPADRDTEAGVGPAQVYHLEGARGRTGFISAMSKPFCEACNRLRLTSTGELRSCLFDGGEMSVLPALACEGETRRQQIVDLMLQCVRMRPEVHSSRGNRAMSQLGG